MDFSHTLQALNIVVLLGTLLVSVGVWKGRREVTTEAVDDLKEQLTKRITVELCDERHGRTEESLGAFNTTTLDLAKLGARVGASEELLRDVSRRVQDIDSRTARMEGMLRNGRAAASAS